MLENGNKYICVECGADATSLYKVFQNGITKLSQCDECCKNVDCYTEYDNVLLLLDLLLHKTKAFRHLLFNQEYKVQWQLLILCGLSDTFIKWQFLHQCGDIHSLPFFKWYAVVSGQFFYLLAITMCEYVVFSVVSLLLIHLSCTLHSKKMSSRSIIKVLSISSYGKVFNMAVYVWGAQDKVLLVFLTKLFVVTSNIQATFVTLPNLKCNSFISVSIGFLTAAIVSWMLQEKIPIYFHDIGYPTEREVKGESKP